MRRVVLAVDDEPDVLLLLRVLLEAEGYEVRTAGDGLEALEEIDTGNVDLVVTDVMMPRMDGVELIRRLRENEATRAIPIVVVTARVGASTGADVTLTKPFSGEELSDACRALLGRD